MYNKSINKFEYDLKWIRKIKSEKFVIILWQK